MGGGLLQLVAYGAQDAYLSGNPQITFWRGLYKRHTNFAMEPFRVNLTGQANWGVKHSAILPRHADLISNTYLEVVLDAGTYNNDKTRLGYNLLKYVELDIGGQVIDRLYGEWMFLWDSLTSTYSESISLLNMVSPGGSVSSTPVVTAQNLCAGPSGRPNMPTVLYIPLMFWFARNPGAALPLIALQYHEVKINILWNDVKFISANFNQTVPAPKQANLLVDYIYLDVEERRRMAQETHEYLIEQTQFNEDKGISTYNNRVDLTFNHPVKELVWVVQPSNYTDCRLPGAGTRLQPFTYPNNVYQQGLQINGQDRVEKKYSDYFNKVQIFQHHTGTGLADGSTTSVGIFCYSFSLRPEEHQPSGTCNFSRIDTATLTIDMAGSSNIDDSDDTTYNVRVYAINYNVLRVMSGMGGLAYSN